MSNIRRSHEEESKNEHLFSPDYCCQKYLHSFDVLSPSERLAHSLLLICRSSCLNFLRRNIVSFLWMVCPIGIDALTAAADVLYTID